MWRISQDLEATTQILENKNTPPKEAAEKLQKSNKNKRTLTPLSPPITMAPQIWPRQMENLSAKIQPKKEQKTVWQEKWKKEKQKKEKEKKK